MLTSAGSAARVLNGATPELMVYSNRFPVHVLLTCRIDLSWRHAPS